MRKQTKLAVGLSAAALLAIGASMTSFASGWVQEGDDWYYVDNSGDYVENKWKSYNGQYFYLGDDGAMLKNELVEDGANYYYVDANGAMVKNTWVAIASDEDEDYDVDYRWYYFGSTGKAYKNTSGTVSTKTINGKKYAFDDEGKMLFGFVDDDLTIKNDESDPVLNSDYYFGSNDDGAMYTGWLKYEDAFDTTDYDDELDYEYYWFYYQSSGMKLAGKTKKISGKWYSFNDDGIMTTGWDSATMTAAKYYIDDLTDGSQSRNTWLYAALPDEVQEDGDEHWFRALKDGTLVTDQTKKINSKYYAFNENGVMAYGLVVMDAPTIGDAKISGSGNVGQANADGNEHNYGIINQDNVSAKNIYEDLGDDEYIYYFSSDETNDGSAKTGTYTLDLADDDYTFGFKKSSYVGMEGIESKKGYLSGIRQDAGDQKYAVVSIGHKLGDGYCVAVLVNSSGTVQTSVNKYYKDDDDYYYVLANKTEVSITLYGESTEIEVYDIYKFSDKDDANALIKALKAEGSVEGYADHLVVEAGKEL